MSSDNQYTALGEPFPPGTPFGFYTDGTNITYGVNVQGVVTDTSSPLLGQGCGVYATALTEPSNRQAQPKSRPGVFAIGDHYGVYGASNTLYDTPTTLPSDVVDHTPVLSPDMAIGHTMFGAIGVAGASLQASGVVGTSALTDREASFANIQNGLVGSVVVRRSGVTGIAGGTFTFGGTGVLPPQPIPGAAGVVGVNLREVTKKELALPLDLGVRDILEDTSPGGGVGVFGWSFRGRGGVFASASPVPIGEPQIGAIENLASAQIRLVPAPVSNADVRSQPLEGMLPPKLPSSGQPGDLMAVSSTGPNQNQGTRLWFCVAPGQWAPVLLGNSIPGSY